MAFNCLPRRRYEQPLVRNWGKTNHSPPSTLRGSWCKRAGRPWVGRQPSLGFAFGISVVNSSLTRDARSCAGSCWLCSDYKKDVRTPTSQETYCNRKEHLHPAFQSEISAKWSTCFWKSQPSPQQTMKVTIKLQWDNHPVWAPKSDSTGYKH